MSTVVAKVTGCVPPPASVPVLTTTEVSVVVVLPGPTTLPLTVTRVVTKLIVVAAKFFSVTVTVSVVPKQVWLLAGAVRADMPTSTPGTGVKSPSSPPMSEAVPPPLACTGLVIGYGPRAWLSKSTATTGVVTPPLSARVGLVSFRCRKLALAPARLRKSVAGAVISVLALASFGAPISAL